MNYNLHLAEYSKEVEGAEDSQALSIVDGNGDKNEEHA